MGRLRWLSTQILLLILSMFLGSCNQESILQTSNGSTPPDLTAPITSTIPDSATLTPTVNAKSVDSICDWPPTQIVGVAISSFHWSDDSADLVYKEKNGEWFIYTISSGETKEHIVGSETTEEPDVFGIQSYEDFFVSPDGKSVVFTTMNQDGSSIYLKKLDDEEPVFLGNIKGLIDKYEWSHDGTRLFLSIDWQSRLGATEAYVYSVDIFEKKVNVVIPHSSEYVDITYFGIAPDDSKLLYVTYAGKDRPLILWNLEDGTSTITDIHVPLTYRWLPDSQEFVAAGYQYQDDGSLKQHIFTYNIETGLVRYISPFQVNAHPNIKDAIQISPSLTKIAFISEDQQNLYLIDCSHIIP